jgi:hypothetical protein
MPSTEHLRLTNLGMPAIRQTGLRACRCHLGVKAVRLAQPRSPTNRRHLPRSAKAQASP